MRWDGSVCIVTKVLRCSILCRRNIFLFSVKCADLLSGPTSLRFNAYRRFFPRGKAAGDMKLVTYVDLEPRLRIIGSIPLHHGLLKRVKVQLYLQPRLFYPPSTTTTYSSYFNMALSTAERRPSSVAVQQMMSSALGRAVSH